VVDLLHEREQRLLLVADRRRPEVLEDGVDQRPITQQLGRDRGV
jgi:hypothetical protein